MAEYEYDGANRRVEKVLTEAGGGPSEAHYYYNSEWQLLEERFLDSQEQLSASNQYLWSARYIDSPIMRFHDGNGDGDCLDAGDNIRYYTGDANFNVTARSTLPQPMSSRALTSTAYGVPTVYDSGWANPAAPRPTVPPLWVLPRRRDRPLPGPQPLL